MPYTDITSAANWSTTTALLKPAISGAKFDTAGDLPNNADLITDSASNALYSTFTTPASGTTSYLVLRAAVNAAFGQTLIINFDIDSGSGLDGKVDFAIIVDTSTATASFTAGNVYASGSDGTGENTRPNNTDYFIDTNSKSSFLIGDSALAKTTSGSNTYIDVVLNFNNLKQLLLDNLPATGAGNDGDAQVVLSPLTNFNETTPVRFALTSSANLNNVNKDISGTDNTVKNPDPMAVVWTDYFGQPTSFSNLGGDITAPKVTGVSSTTANGTYKIGDVISVTVTFDESVTVTGVPQLTLETGATDAIATYAGGSGTNTLTFTYTVTEGNQSSDLDYIAGAALTLINGATIKDAAGNNAVLTLPTSGQTGSLGANKAIVVDGVKPNAPILDLEATSDSGTLATDNVTSDTTPTFSGTAEPNSTVTILIDGDPIGTATASNGGVWSFTPLDTLGDGSYVVTATTEDAAGNVSDVSTAINLKIDTTKPSTPVLDLDADSDSGASNTDNVTSDTTPTFSGTAEAGSEITILNGDTVLGTTTVNGSGNWTFTPTAMQDGNYVITAVAKDAAGNTSNASEKIDLKIDTTAPQLLGASLNGNTLTLSYNEALNSTSGLDPANFQVYGSFNPVPIPLFPAGVTAVEIQGATVILTLSNSIPSPFVFVDYSNKSSPTEDRSGNDALSFVGFPVDDTTGDAIPPKVDSINSTTADGDYKVGEKVLITVTFSEAVNVTGVPQLALDTGASATYTSGTGTKTLTFEYVVGEGEGSPDLDALTITGGSIKDLAGNEATATDLALPGAGNSLKDKKDIVIDGIKPNAPIFDLDAASDTGTAGDDITSALKPKLTGTAEPGSTVTVLVNGVALDPVIATGGTWEVEIPSNQVGTDGTYIVTATAKDKAGNISEVSTPLELKIDRTAPEFVEAVVTNKTLVLTYDGILDANSIPDSTDFEVLVEGSKATITDINVDGKTVTLTLGTDVQPDQEVSVSYTAGTKSVQDNVDNKAVNLSVDTDAKTLKNTSTDTIAPVLTDAEVTGNKLVLTYSEALDLGSVPNGDRFTIQVDGEPVTVTNVKVEGSTVTLTLDEVVQPDQDVTLGYTNNGTNPTQDVTGNDAADLSIDTSGLLKNTSTDTIAPVLTDAEVTGNKLVLTYSEALDLGSVPNGERFTIQVDGEPVTVTNVKVEGSTVTLTLDEAVQPDQEVTLSYTNNGTNPTQDPTGNDAADLSIDTSGLLKNTSTDTIAPVLTDAVVNGITLVLTYDEALNGGSDPVSGDFTVTVGGKTVTVSGVDADGKTVTLTLGTAVQPGEEVKISYTAGTNPIEDVATNPAANITDFAVENKSGDTLAPVLQSAEVVGTKLVLTYDEALNGGSDPVSGDFTVTVGGKTVTVSGVDADGKTVTLTLGTAVQPGEEVKISYTSGTNPIEDVATNPAANITDFAVENKSEDTLAPVLQSAEVVGTKLVLTYDETLNGGSDPLSGDFTVTVGGKTVTVSGVDADGKTVTLTLGTAVQPGEQVKISYTAGTNPIEDVATNPAANITDFAVENKSEDTLAPVLQSAEVVGTKLVLTYDETLNGGSDPVSGDFEVTVGGKTVTVSGVDANGKTVTLTLDGAVQPGEAVNVSYTAGTNPIEDVAGNDAGNITDFVVENKSGDTLAPVLQSAEVVGTKLVLTYDETLNGVSDPLSGDFVVTVGGKTVTVSGADADGKTVTLTLDSAVQLGEEVKVSYTAGTKPIEDVAGNDAANLSDEAVTNNSGDSIAPKVTAVSSAAENGTYKTGAVLLITVTFDEPVFVEGEPKLTLETGATDAIATYASGSGTSTLTFEYTVGEGEESPDLDYIAAALSLNSGTIKDSAGNNADLSLPTPGETGSLAANKDIKIDAIKPDAPVVDVDAGSDLGTSDTDNITNVKKPLFTGTAEPNSDVTILIDGEVLGTATADNSGAWTFKPETALGDGKYKITATATDAAGNVGSASAPLDLEIDTKAPAVSINAVKSNDASPKLTGTIDDPSAKVSVIMDGTTYAATNTGNGTWTLSKGQLAELSSGEYDFTVVATDVAGNERTLDTAASPIGDDKPLVIDTTAPTGKIRVSVSEEELKSIEIRFDEPVKKFDISDLKLDLDGTPVSLSGATLKSSDGIVWKLDGLSDRLSVPGTYTLSLKGSNDVTDAFGNAVGAVAAGKWTLEHICEFAEALPAIAIVDAAKSLSAKDMDLQNREIGTPGANKIVGKKGGDSIIGGKGNDVIFGGDGGDLIKGGRDLDQLHGDAGDDLLSGRGGDDVLEGFVGNDSLLGGRDTDSVDGGKGNDYMSGRGGKDNLVGMQGHDMLQGGSDSDILDGGKGSDRAKAGGGKDQLLGQGGNDLLSAGGGNDKLHGGKQHDYLLGKGGNDRLLGDDGDDVLWGGKGKDTLKGGIGRDTLVFKSLKEGTDKVKGFNVTDDLIDMRKLCAKTFGKVDLHKEFESLVQRVQVGSDTQIRVDIDGTDAETKFATIATLKGVNATTVTCSSFIVE